MTLHPANPELLALEPFVIARPATLTHLDMAPFGRSVDVRVDPLRLAAEPLLRLLVRLDAVTFGPEGMPMPRWVFVDGAELPGAIVGLGRRARDLDASARALLEAPADPDALVPLSMYIAIPAFEPGVWVGHNLASVAAQVGGGALRGLGGFTKALALAVLRARVQIGVTQWRHPALRLHARLGPLEILSAWTPAHSEPASLTYRVAIDEPALRNLAQDPGGRVARPAADLFVDSDDRAALEALQLRIEAGERFVVVAPPVARGHERQRAPIARIGARPRG